MATPRGEIRKVQLIDLSGDPYTASGGGGGASEVGANGITDTIGGDGGDGLAYSIRGTGSVYYAGGGGGATFFSGDTFGPVFWVCANGSCTIFSTSLSEAVLLSLPSIADLSSSRLSSVIIPLLYNRYNACISELLGANFPVSI